MNRDEFLSQLRRALDGLSQADIEDVLQYYEEMIIDKAADQGIDEEDVIAGLGSVADIAKGVRASVAPEAEAELGPADDLGSKVLTDIAKGGLLTEDNIAPDSTRLVYKLRQLQDAMLAAE